MPSHAEGYGLPLIEALCVGTPVIASDLPAHRDVAGDYAIYRHPMDGLGWLAAVETLATTRMNRKPFAGGFRAIGRRLGRITFQRSSTF